MQGKSGGRIIGHAEQIKGHHVMNARRRKMTKKCSWIPQVMIVLNRNDPPPLQDEMSDDEHSDDQAGGQNRIQKPREISQYANTVT